jgi:hypothetical protein
MTHRQAQRRRSGHRLAANADETSSSAPPPSQTGAPPTTHPSASPPTTLPRGRPSFGAIMNHLGVPASLVAVAISLWSTRIAQKAQEFQADQSRQAQASQVMLFSDDPSSAGVYWPGQSFADIYIRNYSRLPLFGIYVIASEEDQGRTAYVSMYQLAALAPCRQYLLNDFVMDALQRASAADQIRLSAQFQDANGEYWQRDFGAAVGPERGDGVPVSRDYSGAQAVAEPIPDCTPG